MNYTTFVALKQNKTIKERLSIIRERLKILESKQVIDKGRRKTGSLIPAGQQNSKAASDVEFRKIEITGLLNVYHELRGSDYRHIPKDIYIRMYLERITNAYIKPQFIYTLPEEETQ